MLLLLILFLLLSVTGALVVMTIAAILAIKPSTRSIGLRIFLVGGIGILLTNIFVLIVNPPALDGHSEFAFLWASCFGFACAGGVAELVAVAVLVKRKKKRTPD